MNEGKGTDRPEKKERLTFLYIITGGALKGEFVVKHMGLIIWVVLWVLLYMGNQLSFRAKLLEIGRLQQELKELKQETVTQNGRLTGSNRQSQIEEWIKAQGLELESAKTPPYILHR
ncbi:MAG: hypothetical protein LBD27_03105 [Tannerella sp.]|jgi:hypothetical protein|nr:hypothetical protein [Tannerella sp.]